MPRRLLSAAAAGALLLGLAACGEPADGPATTPPPSIDIGTPSDGGGDTEPSDGDGEETTEPTAEAPDIPAPDPADYAGMDEHTPEGAEQAFRYYIAVSIWAHQTGDRNLLTPLESDSCQGCNKFNGDISVLQNKELLWSASTVTDNHTAVRELSENEQEVRYKFTLGPHSRPNNEQTERVDLDSLEFDSAGNLAWHSDQWVIEGLSIEWGSNVH